MQSLNVLLLNYEYPPLGGGAGIVTQKIAREFAGDPAIHLHIITSSCAGESVREEYPSVTVHSLGIGKDPSRLLQQSSRDLLAYAWKSFWYARRLLRREEFSLVHAYFSVPSGLIALLLGKPYIVSLMGADIPFANPKYRIIDSLLLQWLTPLIWKRAASVIAVSSMQRDSAARIFRREYSVIHPGVDTDRFQPDHSRRDERQFTILFAGRLATIKNINALLEAALNLSKRHSGLCLDIVGDGPLRRKLEKRVSEAHAALHVRFHGHIRSDDIVQYYQNAHVLVLPSMRESFGNVLLEAMACGLPVITTRAVGGTELIDGNGIILENGTAPAIQNALETLIGDPALRTSMGNRGRMIAEGLQWSSAASKYRDIYSAVSSGTAPVSG